VLYALSLMTCLACTCCCRQDEVPGVCCSATGRLAGGEGAAGE
jgi:hypothetical protein